MPKISVIVPVYNTEDFLLDALESISKQSFSDFEVLIIDDCSTDKSKSIAQKFIEQDKRFFLLSNSENKGPSYSRNKGLDHIQGKWVTFVDSDDILDSKFLEILFFAIQSKNVDLACCSAYSFRNSTDLKIKRNNTSLKVLSGEEALKIALYQKGYPDHSPWNKLYNADLWKKRRFPVGVFFEDMATIPWLFLDAKKVAYINEPLYLYRKHNNSILRTPYTEKKAELLDTAEKLFSSITKEYPRLSQAGMNTVFSASCSILMKTPHKDNFSSVQKRAWKHIVDLRMKLFFDPNIRIKNRLAILLSFMGFRLFQKIIHSGIK